MAQEFLEEEWSAEAIPLVVPVRYTSSGVPQQKRPQYAAETYSYTSPGQRQTVQQQISQKPTAVIACGQPGFDHVSPWDWGSKSSSYGFVWPFIVIQWLVWIWELVLWIFCGIEFFVNERFTAATWGVFLGIELAVIGFLWIIFIFVMLCYWNDKGVGGRMGPYHRVWAHRFFWFLTLKLVYVVFFYAVIHEIQHTFNNMLPTDVDTRFASIGIFPVPRNVIVSIMWFAFLAAYIWSFIPVTGFVWMHLIVFGAHPCYWMHPLLVAQRERAHAARLQQKQTQGQIEGVPSGGTIVASATVVEGQPKQNWASRYPAGTHPII
jgi:hypothetical protein